MNTSTDIPAGLVSVIISCCDELELSRQCLVALVRHTRSPWELIVVDNASTDGTASYLGGVQDASPIPVTVITNPVKRRCTAAANQALGVARGDYLVLLDNDVIVTDAW